MSLQDEAIFQDAGGDEEYTGSDVVDRHTRVISDDIFKILRDPDAREWDSDAVLLNDGYRLQLWSDHSPAPLGRENESLVDFTT